MTLHVWSRITCRWVRWRGTLAAWKLLPHAVVTASCLIAVGSITAWHLHVDAPLPVVPVPPSVYTAGIGYLNPMHSFESVPEPWVGGPGYVAKCDPKDDHDRDDCKRRSVPEPGTWALMVAGLGMIWIRSLHNEASNH